jgi:hypothetical protein
MIMHFGPSRFLPSGALGACAAASLAMWAVGANIVRSQGGPPPGLDGPPPRIATPEPPRQGGLKIAPYGYTVGDGGGLEKEYRRNGAVPPPPPLAPDAPPPNPDPRDFAGTWYGDQYIEAFEILKDMYGNAVPFNARGHEVMDRRLIAQDSLAPFITPAIMCRPSGPVWTLMRIPFRIFQTPEKISVFPETDRAWWQIAMNPAIAPPAGTRFYMGRSVGHWEADTLVVETTDFKNRLWLSFRGTPLSASAMLTQRIRKVREDRWFLEIVYTVNDPVHYTRPWSFVRTFSWRPDFALQSEYNCEEQVGDKTNTNTAAGFVREPED